MFTDEPPANATAQLVIDYDEIDALARLIGVNDRDEDRPTGHIRLVTRNGRRHWFATDSYRLGRIIGMPDEADIDVLLPARLFSGVENLRSISNDFVLYQCERDDGSSYYLLRGDLGEISGPAPIGVYPPVDEIMEEIDARTTDATIDAAFLARAVDATGYGWSWLPRVDESDAPATELGLSPDGVWIASRWNVGTPTTLMVDAEMGGRIISARVNASYLYDLLSRFDGEVRISFGADAQDSISFTDGTFTALLMPITTGTEHHRRHVESVISDVFGPDALNRDEIGDYQIQATGVPVWARLLDLEPPTLRVLATVAAEIENSPELLHELNEINTTLAYVRVHWADGFVTVNSDLVAETLDAEELHTAYTRARRTAVDMSEVITTMYGGQIVNSDAERWSGYRNTVIFAELYPEARHYLNGPDSIEEWPFTNDVFVITAHDPFGIQRSEADNRAANRELSMEISRMGGRFCSAIGSSRDGEHSEAGFAVWNLDFDQAMSLGRQFRQEAIFMVTAEEFRLIDLRDGSIVDIAARRV